MIENTEQWFKTLANLLGRLDSVRPSDNPSPYQVMGQVKKFLVTEGIGPEKLRRDLVAVLEAGLMTKNAAEIASHMRSVVRNYQKQQLNLGTENLKMAEKNLSQDVSVEQMAAIGAGRE